MTAAPARSLVRPSLNTKFHIDFDWWDRAERDLEVYLRSHLCPTHQETYADVDPARKVDHVDPETGEVTRVAGIQHVLISHCAQQPGYLTGQTSLVNAVFRVFLSNGNTPLSPEELSERIGRPAQMILRTLTGPRVYKGIRPYAAV
jgi:hypothetical protein